MVTRPPGRLEEEGPVSRDPIIDAVEVSAFTVPTDGPESDGTLEWSETTAVVVELQAGDRRAIGYTYTDKAAVPLIADKLSSVLLGRTPFDTAGARAAMVRECRNLGWPGLASMAISACDVALWDLKGKLLGRALVDLLGGPVRDEVPVYGSGGFCSYSPERLREQLGGWAEQGMTRVKMKVGREPGRDFARVATARQAVGPRVGLMVDANGAYERKQALEKAAAFAELGVVWFEEPVSSDDLEGLRLVRDRAPAGLEVAAGEYGWDAWYFRRMLEAGAVDVLQVDATRCGGPTGFGDAAALARGFGVAVSAHTAPTLHAHVGAATSVLRDVEYFHDHVRVEALLFDGALRARGGTLRPDRGRPGLGIELRRRDAARRCVAREVRTSGRAGGRLRRWLERSEA